MEALLQELVINVEKPDGQFILGTDNGYFQYVTEGDANEYREIEYPEDEDLDNTGAQNGATAFELIKRDGDEHYLMIEDDDGLYIVTHSNGTREPIDDVLEGTGNDKSDAESKELEEGKNPLHYIVKLTYAPSKHDHVKEAKNIKSVHLRGLDEQGQAKLWLYKNNGENDRLESSSMRGSGHKLAIAFRNPAASSE